MKRNYGKSVTLRCDFAAALERVRRELQAEGFGILTEIDVTATMRSKLGAEMEDYVILGACNPPLAHRALESDRHIGLLLPCNVVVRSAADGTIVEVLDPRIIGTLSDSSGVAVIADEAAERLDRALLKISVG